MKHIVIIGNSAAGLSAAEAIRKNDKGVKISMVSEEQYPPYMRLKIAEILMNNVNPEKLFLKPYEFYKQENIDLLPGKKVDRVIPKKNSIILFDKTKIVYDALIVASGRSANISKDVKGANKHGVLGFRSISNARDIMELIPISNTVCIWGAGIAGINAAYGLSKKHREIKVITCKERILEGIIGEEKARSLENSLREKGVEIIFNKSVVEIFGNGDVKAIKLDSGKVIGCGILILDKNLTPNTKFLENTEVDINLGVRVDEFLRSSVENIFAAGDVLSKRDHQEEYLDLLNSWDSAVNQGKIAGENALKFTQARTDQMIPYADIVQNRQLRILGLTLEAGSGASLADESADLSDCNQEDS
ncbi:MAG: FAD-dependent oxidoreductase [Candidatus Omnitrophica bacterium]|nr:FAD-dependent oxidoreductase [Candidatus Omnitrophota bacterium]